MSNEESKMNPMFLHLVLSLQSAAWYQMGKTVSPISGKMERDLDQARASIDMLLMLKEKTSGNLSEEEKKIFDNTLYTLQMNYVDEREKGDAEADAGSSAGESSASDAENIGKTEKSETSPDDSSDG